MLGRVTDDRKQDKTNESYNGEREGQSSSEENLSAIEIFTFGNIVVLSELVDSTNDYRKNSGDVQLLGSGTDIAEERDSR